MLSPFPGMDPWLENPGDWSGFHDILIIATVQVLQPQLRSRGYYAKPGERVWLTQPRRPIYPDVALIRQSASLGAESSSQSGLAVAEPDEPIRILREQVELHEGFVDIYDAGGNRLVTSIEYVSPTNKSDSEGRDLYLRKQKQAREAGIHLVEIDFIRRGPHVLDVPLDVVAGLPRWDYLVNLVRRGASEYEIYAIRLRDRLPRIRLPLTTGEADAALDLQEVFNVSYGIGPYPESLAYGEPSATPLASDDQAWADEVLAKARVV